MKSEKIEITNCKMIEQGYKRGSCLTFYKPDTLYTPGYLQDTACKVTLKWENDKPYRLLKSIQLSRPEDYLSIYQSGCNFSCLKCHSWEFTQFKNGEWMSPIDIVEIVKDYAKIVTVNEPKERATAFHSDDLCRNCGLCVLEGKRSSICPGKLRKEQILLSPQGFGPARNIVAFTGGDIACNPEWYLQTASKIKELNLNLWVLFETNGYGLTPRNLDLYKDSGIDSFWLDIKAFKNEIHRKLTGCDNDLILKLPEEILKRGFTLEVLTLYIPGWVEVDEIKKIAEHLVKLEPNIPFTILAFFGAYRLKNLRSPNLDEMLKAYRTVKEVGLRNVRLGNIGLFVKNEEEYSTLLKLTE
ncbi:MAG: radical SAM protein [Candidatus Hydrothermales bacterium]